MKLEVSNRVKLRTDHDAFLHMLRNTIEHHQDKISDFIYLWWRTTFPNTSFPEKGGTLNEFKVAIQYGLIRKAHEKYGIRMTSKFMLNYHTAMNFSTLSKEKHKSSIIDLCESYNKLSTIYIRRDIIKMKKKHKIKKEEELQTIVAGKGKTKKAPKAKPLITTNGDLKKKKNVVEKEYKTLRALVCDMLMERRHTDEEIYNEAKRLFPNNKVYPSIAASRRLDIKKGKIKEFPAPKRPLKKITGEDLEKQE